MSNHYFGITDLGKVRENNEDAFLVEALRAGDRVLAAVIDGVGGYEGGEVAAAIAKASIAELLNNPLNDAPEVLREALIKTNDLIIEEKKAHPGKEKMACVLTLALADNAANQFHYAHVGDTRLYLLRGASLVKVSKDHSFVGFLEESNRITELNAMRHPKRNEVNNVLGLEANIASKPDYIDTGSSPFLPGDLLLLCSDGLTDMVGSGAITDILSGTGSISEKAQALVNAANGAGGRDNVTVVLVQNPNAPKTHDPTPPVSKKKADTPAEIAEERPSKARAGNPLVWILSLVSIGLAGLLIWQYTRPQKPAAAIAAMTSKAEPATKRRQRNPAEQMFLDSVTAGSGTAVDTTLFKSPLLISDTIIIDKDSFRLSGNGIVLRGDSGIQGPCFYVPEHVRYVVLEDIVFENFSTAIIANKSALRLHNVRFRNCGTAVSYGFRFPDTQYVQGSIQDGFPFKTDSLADKK